MTPTELNSKEVQESIKWLKESYEKQISQLQAEKKQLEGLYENVRNQCEAFMDKCRKLEAENKERQDQVLSISAEAEKLKDELKEAKEIEWTDYRIKRLDKQAIQQERDKWTNELSKIIYPIKFEDNVSCKKLMKIGQHIEKQQISEGKR